MVNDNLLSLSYGRIVAKDINAVDGLLPESFETYQIVVPGDVIFRFTDLQNDKRSLRSALCEQYGIITSAYLAVAPRGISPGYLAHLMRGYDHTKVFYALGSGLRQSLKYDDIKRLPLLIPPLEEQTQIAKFLDYETAKIDALIEKQQQLIALLNEKRQAVISHAVTKGLNPNAPMRDSGIEWLGQVPAHWGVSRLKFLVSHVIDCHHSTPRYDQDAPFPALRTADVTPGYLDVAGARRVHLDEYTERISRLKPAAGDIVYSREGERWGMAAQVPGDVDLCLAQRVMLFRANELVLGEFLMWGLNSVEVYNQLAVEIVGATSPHVNISEIKEAWLAVPPAAEQGEIVEYLRQSLAKMDQLDRQCRLVVDSLQERRTALISAAVTGKIDVRGWKPPAANPNPAEAQA
jgi:type I restriction enzyme S subunit